jgi:hypothetical protein
MCGTGRKPSPPKFSPLPVGARGGAPTGTDQLRASSWRSYAGAGGTDADRTAANA